MFLTQVSLKRLFRQKLNRLCDRSFVWDAVCSININKKNCPVFPPESSYRTMPKNDLMCLTKKGPEQKAGKTILRYVH